MHAPIRHNSRRNVSVQPKRCTACVETASMTCYRLCFIVRPVPEQRKSETQPLRTKFPYQISNQAGLLRCWKTPWIYKCILRSIYIYVARQSKALD